MEINKKKNNRQGLRQTEKKKDPDDGSPKLQQLQAISKIDKNQSQWSNCSSEIAKQTTIFMATVAMDYLPSKQTTKQ